ncbi:hypothetical protein KR215_000153 [Drosophila sulfurigaster]|uniref:Transferase CAF17 homolog, mitochondrial n=1 Tax=Drosophila albomicans TaxID=7291 RepID=A0A6P8ZCF7_DROAB|nr:putative transferase CAF17 homolog, mitochondrial [Drosophila albomicans]KAH8407288.1 hypothetical protein KR215_000153 [Drosophila sulfurigaster]
MNVCKNFKFLRIAQLCIRNFSGSNRLTAAAGALGARGSSNGGFILEPLTTRELIRVHGAEAVPFLQGLVTNDVSRLQEPHGAASIYALFLNRNGRVMYDTIIYRTNDPDTFLLECDRDASSDFRRHLRTYRVRKRIDIDTVDDEYVPWVLYNEQKQQHLVSASKSNDLFVTTDPRIDGLGTRILAPTDLDQGALSKRLWRNHEVVAAPHTSDDNYQLLRYKQGIGEGIEELPPGKCFPLEANADYLNGVSFNKGCYVGQELTARVHHSGVIRKRYMPVRFTAPVSSNYTVKSVAGANLGRVLGHSQNRGVALLRIEPVLGGQQQLVLDGERCYVDRPQWWPNDAVSNKRMFAAVE